MPFGSRVDHVGLNPFNRTQLGSRIRRNEPVHRRRVVVVTVAFVQFSLSGSLGKGTLMWPDRNEPDTN